MHIELQLPDQKLPDTLSKEGNGFPNVEARLLTNPHCRTRKIHNGN
jgi:hypothetical protein